MLMTRADAPRLKIAVCVITLHRPAGLAALLEGLSKLTFSKVAAPEVRVMLVDNDAGGSAKAVAEAAPEGLEVCYCVEPKKGIPIARNRTVEAALPWADYCAFIDDDEVPPNEWLDELLAAQRRFGADVVTGPVRTVFADPPPPWILEGKFFAPQQFTTGTELEVCATNNTLVRAELFQNRRFDERFALTGGEDTQLFMRLKRVGHTIIWAEDAYVTETMPSSRANLSWLLKRSYREGNSYALAEFSVDNSLKRKLLRFSKGVTRLAQGGLGALMNLGRKPAFVRHARRAYLGAGMISGVLGNRYEEYKEIHGV